MSWDDLRYFLAAHRHGSLAASGRALGVDHTTVGRRIAALEAQLGARLFNRARDGLRLTVAGQHVLERAERVASAIEDVERCAGTFDDATAGQVVLATSNVVGNGLIAPALHALLDKHPGLQIDLVTGQRLTSLPRREADVALRSRPSGKAAGEQEVLASRVGSLAFGVYVARDADEEPMIRYAHGPGEPGAAWIVANAADASVGVRVNEVPSALEACRAGLGRAVLPHVLADRDPTLRRVAPRVESHNLYIALHPDLRQVPRVKVVAAWLRALVKKHARLLSGRGPDEES